MIFTNGKYGIIFIFVWENFFTKNGLQFNSIVI